MIRKAKVCLIGATAVGKSSLVARYVTSIFSESYRTTIGVKIETRTVVRPLGSLELVIWDLSGEDEFQTVQPAYLRGARGCLLVVDSTRRSTLDVAKMLETRLRTAVEFVPFVVVLNKVDLVAEWDIAPRELEGLESWGHAIVKASAKTGDGVEEAFSILADKILEGQVS